MTLATLLAALLAAPQEKPVRLKFDVQHMPATPEGKPRPLKSVEVRDFEAELMSLPACQEAACTESSASLTLKPGATLKLSELRAAGKKTLGTDAGKPVIVFNTIKLEGHVALTLHVEKNPEKVREALKAFPLELLSESGETFECRFKSAVPVLSVVKAAAAKAGVEYKVFEILKDVAWTAPAAK